MKNTKINTNKYFKAVCSYTSLSSLLLISLTHTINSFYDHRKSHLKNIHTIEGQTLLRAGEFEATLPEFLAHVKAKLGCDTLRYVDGGKPIRKVAVGGGACAGERQKAIDAGCDAFVTSDIGYNAFWDAQELGLTMIDAGHFHTENPSMYVMAQKLRDTFPEVEVVLSQKHADCMKFY